MKMNLKWNYTNKMVNDLVRINRAREVVDLLPLPISIEEEIKKETMVKRVHYSTKIEGNKLNLDEVKKVINSDKKSHERSVLEVRNYYNALMYLNKESEHNDTITEDLIFRVHNLVSGKHLTYKNSYRDNQNVVADSLTGKIVYMPPEAKDVSSLIKNMIKRFNSKDNNIPTYILKAYGYDLKGFYVMEEFYDKNINEYYNSLQMGLNHNFYFGRNNADITEWLEYFVSIMADTFEIVGNRVKEIYNNSKEEINIIDTLDKRERWVANYLINNGKVKSKDISNHFKINLDTANNWIKKWIEKGFLKRFDDKQIRNVDYILTEKYLEKLK